LKPLVSIIIPNYQRIEPTIRAAESVLSQSYANWELILVDDGSDENVWKTLISLYPSWKREFIQFGKNQKSIQMFQREHKGVSATRNFAVAMSKGEWLCFLDSDDVWEPNKLTKQIEYHQLNPNVRISQTNERWIRNGYPVPVLSKHQKKSGNFFQDALELCLITPSSVMIRRDLWLEEGGFREELQACEDYDLWVRILAKDEYVGLVEENLLTRYGGHFDQLSAKFQAIERFRIYALIKLLLEVESKLRSIDNLKKQMTIHSAISRLHLLLLGRQKRDKECKPIQELLNCLDVWPPNITQNQKITNINIIENLKFLLEESQFQ